MNSWAYLYVTLWLRCVSLWSNSIYSFIYNKCADKSFPTFLCWGTNFLNFECLLWLGYVLRPVMKKGSVRFESTWSHDIVTLEKLLKSNFLCGDHLTHLIPGDKSLLADNPSASSSSSLRILTDIKYINVKLFLNCTIKGCENTYIC